MAGLARYLVKRGIDRFILIIVVVSLQFLLLRVIPIYVQHVDPTRFLIDLDSPLTSEEQKSALREQFGLNLPIWQQYGLYVLNLFRLDMGISFLSRRPVQLEIAERLPNTLALIGVSTVIDFIIGLSLGLYIARKRGKLVDSLTMQLAIFSYVMPSFLMAIIMLMAFAWYPRIAFGVGLFPVSGTRTPFLPDDPWIQLGDYLWHLSLPVMAVATTNFGARIYYFRNLTITDLGQDYVLTARAKGIKEGIIMRRHVLRSVAAPVITVIGLTIPGLIGGLIITESIFSWYGMGQYVFQGINSYDYPAVQAYLFLVALLIAISLYFVDLVTAWIDPRVRLR